MHFHKKLLLNMALEKECKALCACKVNLGVGTVIGCVCVLGPRILLACHTNLNAVSVAHFSFY